MQGRQQFHKGADGRTMLYTGRAHPAKSGVLALLLLFVTLATGCSWTSSLFGSGDEPPETPQTAQKQEDADAEHAAAQQEVPPARTEQAPLTSEKDKPSDSLVPRPDRGKSSTGSQEEELEKQAKQPAAKSEKTPEETPARTPETGETPETPETGETPEAGEDATAGNAPEEVAALQEPQAAQSKEPEPPIKAKGAVPIEPSVKSRLETPAPATQDKVYYKTTEELHQAIQEAIDSEKFLGYTDPFDAFPVLDGVDTMSAAFIPVDHPDHKVFYHAFFQPTKPFHKRVYGYTVINMKTNQDFGYFDGNADGVFEQETLDPKIVLDDYLRASEAEAKGQAQD